MIISFVVGLVPPDQLIQHNKIKHRSLSPYSTVIPFSPQISVSLIESGIPHKKGTLVWSGVPAVF
jgi:hypothetical protein